MLGSSANAPRSTVVCVRLLCAPIPLFSQQPCVAWMYTPTFSEPVAFCISFAITLLSSSCSVPRLAHHCAIRVYLESPISVSAAIIPMYATL